MNPLQKSVHILLNIIRACLLHNPIYDITLTNKDRNTYFCRVEKATSGPVFYLHSSLLKLSKLWDPNFSFNYLKQIHFLSQSFENLLKQGT